MSHTKTILSATVAALVLSFGTAQAAPTTAPDSNGAAPAMHGHAGAGGPGAMHRGRHAGFEKALARLHGQLNLNGEQEKLWRTAVDQMKSNRAEQRASRREAHKQLHAMMQQPILDLNALHSARNKMSDDSRQRREITTAAWLNFYNALDNQQKTTVSTALKTHWARMAKMRAHWHHGMQHQGMHGRMQHGDAAPAGAMAPSAASQ
jgi:uncharacterized membrane protein